MKMTTVILALLSSFAALACPEISGTYLCPEDAEDDIALGAREVTFKKSTIGEMFVMKVKDASTLYELNSWNPAINPTTGEVDHNIMTMAECKENKVLLIEEITEADEDVSVTMKGAYEVSPTAEGINLVISLEGEEFFNFDCKKI